MGKGKVRTGYNPKTMENLHTGAGAFFKNFNVGVDTYDSARTGGKLLGATQGGGEFKAVADIRNVEIDGLPGKGKGTEIIDSWDVSLAMTFIETTPETLALSLGAADIDTTSNGTYDIIQGRNGFDDSDYIDNITYIGTLTGSVEPIIIQVFNALSTDGLDIKVEDKKEGAIPVTVYGHYEDNGDGSLDAPPFKIYYPKGSNAATPVASVKGGAYATSQTVALTCATTGASIYYTTNGFEPTAEDTSYSTSITVATDMILKAKAIKTGMADSATMTETYRIGE
ncbi:chitobiase/beta-hexosaminidase C-terminal domain-containing protein [Acetobacterium tundrae]|uniref:GH29D-like beta-sandwich domain-containing protein n=1 Tax=Acetobacterium tundrae TaxID=132932 RepID=A0ABR6WIW4_9FIRM|nr:chitobiase/beta-hexosaminidase C-terminal domain-containing protein [Acetobacterium tundrae]MBC3796433.1 hypothetical protein [Acetobacterium tundrae]